jgi:hypothetical protein
MALLVAMVDMALLAATVAMMDTVALLVDMELLAATAAMMDTVALLVATAAMVVMEAIWHPRTNLSILPNLPNLLKMIPMPVMRPDFVQLVIGG